MVFSSSRLARCRREGQRGGAGGPTKATMLTDAINWAIAQNSDKSSPYYNKLDVTEDCGRGHVLRRIADAGGRPRSPHYHGDDLQQWHSGRPRPRHGRDAQADQGPSGEPAHAGDLHPGRREGHRLQQRHGRLPPINHVPVFVANLNVGHGGTYSRPHGGDFAKVATAWFQWQLKGDKQAAGMFEGEPCGVAPWPVGRWRRRKSAKQNPDVPPLHGSRTIISGTPATAQASPS